MTKLIGEYLVVFWKETNKICTQDDKRVIHIRGQQKNEEAVFSLVKRLEKRLNICRFFFLGCDESLARTRTDRPDQTRSRSRRP